MPKRLTFTFDDDAIELLQQLAGSSHNQSKFLNDLIRRAAKEQGNGEAALRREIADIAGALATATARLRELAGEKRRG
jgi:polyhydroxyalkanoate synthesis regulator phasin